MKGDNVLHCKRSATAILVAVPSLATAQERITSGLAQASNWASGLVASVGVLCLMYAAGKKMWGDPTANQQLGGVVVGGALGLGAAGLFQMVKNWFG